MEKDWTCISSFGWSFYLLRIDGWRPLVSRMARCMSACIGIDMHFSLLSLHLTLADKTSSWMNCGAGNVSGVAYQLP